MLPWTNAKTEQLVDLWANPKSKKVLARTPNSGASVCGRLCRPRLLHCALNLFSTFALCEGKSSKSRLSFLSFSGVDSLGCTLFFLPLPRPKQTLLHTRNDNEADGRRPARGGPLYSILDQNQANMKHTCLGMASRFWGML